MTQYNHNLVALRKLWIWWLYLHLSAGGTELARYKKSHAVQHSVWPTVSQRPYSPQNNHTVLWHRLRYKTIMLSAVTDVKLHAQHGSACQKGR
jgi:hypothetical protein